MPNVERASRTLATAVALAALAIGGFAVAHADDAKVGGWERVSDKEGILVERRAVAGSSLKEFLGRGVVDAPVGRVLAVIRDAGRRAEWMPACSDSHLVEENFQARTQVAYHRTKAPWPVSDRDSINRAEILVQPDKHRVYLPFQAITMPSQPPVKGVVRMPEMRGHWQLVPIAGGKQTEVEYQVYANPGGSLPDWVANLASKALPRETIAGLRKQVQRAQYPQFEAEIAAMPEAKALMESAAK